MVSLSSEVKAIAPIHAVIRRISQAGPRILEGGLAGEVYQDYQKAKVAQFNNDPNLKLEFNAKEGILTNCTAFDLALINQVLVPRGLRVILPEDLQREEVQEAARSYTLPINALVLRRLPNDKKETIYTSRQKGINGTGKVLTVSESHTRHISLDDTNHPRNNSLINLLALQINENQLRIKPALITGYDLQLVSLPSNNGTSEDSEDYRLRFVQNPDFKVVYDERLRSEKHGQRFTTFDKLGLPILSAHASGRVWFTAEENTAGLSTLCLDQISLDSGSGALSFTNRDRRVMITERGSDDDDPFNDEGCRSAARPSRTDYFI